MKKSIFTNESIANIHTSQELIDFLHEENVNYKSALKRIKYERELENLQIELLKLQNWVSENKKKVIIIFEGRDAAGKGGSIRRFTRYLNHRSARVVALGKPTDVERGQWYFRRHVKELPNEGEIVFFDRSWYNRAVVEPVMGFCTDEEYQQFMLQVPEFENMLHESGVIFIKLWFSISKDEQAKRFESRKTSPLKMWKISEVDLKSRKLWDDYTHYIHEMFMKTHTHYSPWVIVKSDKKKKARLESIRYVLSQFAYDGKEDGEYPIYPDPDLVHRFSRSMFDIV